MDKSKNELPLIGRRGSIKIKSKKKLKEKKTEEKRTEFECEKDKDKDKEEKGKNEEINDQLKKKKENELECKKIENTIEEWGIPMAFNVIFSELITKQIMPENFFSYTSLRLKEIGKEIEGLKIKKPLYIDRLKEKVPIKRCKTDGDKMIKKDGIFMTVQKK